MSKQVQTIHEAVEYAMVKLIVDQAFYSNLLLNMKRQITTDVPTLGVSVTDTVNLFINPHFFMSLTPDEQVSILIHECLHVVNNHIARFKELEPNVYNKEEKDIFKRIEAMQNASTLNVAADLAINEYLPNLPKKMKCFNKDGSAILEPDTMKDPQGNEIPNPNAGKPIEGEPCLVTSLQKKMPHKSIERCKNMEYYYEILKEEQQEQNGQGQGQGNGTMIIDDHSLWGEGSSENPEYITEKIKQIVNKALDASGGREAGNIPSELQAMLDALYYKPRNWKNDLRRFAARATEVLIEESRKRRNRRFGILYPGTKSFPKTRLAACVDTSGSMSDESLNQILAELLEISKNNVEITLIEADCEVHNVSDFNPKKVKSFSGRGGTAYGPAINSAKALGVDGIIYFGDMDSSDRPENPKIPFLWVVVDSNQKPPAEWGAKTYVKINKKK
jgi:predicted metal-dependent peptidase